jgi:hypothetical protein
MQLIIENQKVIGCKFILTNQPKQDFCSRCHVLNEAKAICLPVLLFDEVIFNKKTGFISIENGKILMNTCKISGNDELQLWYDIKNKTYQIAKQR